MMSCTIIRTCSSTVGLWASSDNVTVLAYVRFIDDTVLRTVLGVTHLYGREAELEVVEAALAAADGDAGCVLVEGLPGLGKSSFVDAAVDRATSAGVGVAAGRAQELDRAAPLSTLLRVLSEGPATEPAVADLRTAEPFAPGLIGRLDARLAGHAGRRPLLIAIDDVHLSDEMTTLALRTLIPRHTAGIVWLLAHRPLVAPAPVQDTLGLLLGHGARRVRLGPLPEAAVAELSAELTGGSAEPGLSSLLRGAGGNPALLVRLLTALCEEGRIELDGDRAEVVGVRLPTSFVDAVNRRLQAIAPNAWPLLEAGAVLARPFTVHEAAALLRRSASSLLGGVDEALISGVLCAVGTDLAFRHDLIRDAVHDGIALPVRSALHREAVGVLREGRRPAAEMLAHSVAGNRRGDELVGELLALCRRHPAEQGQLIPDAVRQLAAAGRVGEAKRLVDRAAHADADPYAQAETILALTDVATQAGLDFVVADHALEVLNAHGLPEPARAQLLAVQAHGLLHCGDVRAADIAGAEAVTVGRQTDEPEALVMGALARSAAAEVRGRLESSRTYATEAVTAADHNDDDTRRRHPRLWLAAALTALDQFDEAEETLAVGEREAARLGSLWSVPLWHHQRALLSLAAGRLSDAEADIRAGLRTSVEFSSLRVRLQLMQARLAILRGRLRAAGDHLRRAELLTAAGNRVAPEELAWPLAVLQDAEGQPGAALTTLADVYATLPDRLLLLVREPQAAPALVHIALKAEMPDLAASVVGAVRQLAARNRGTSLTVAAAHAAGLLSGDLKVLRAAVDAARRCPRPLVRVALLEDTALAEQSAGNAGRAVTLLKSAHRQLVQVGATRDASRVGAEVRRLTAGHRRSAKEPATGGWGDLTAAELRVVGLVAEGLTNREVARRLFLSPHTVDSHLRSSFAKLGVASRVELTRIVITHDAPLADRGTA